jgi:hypothetical protein
MNDRSALPRWLSLLLGCAIFGFLEITELVSRSRKERSIAYLVDSEWRRFRRVSGVFSYVTPEGDKGRTLDRMKEIVRGEEECAGNDEPSVSMLGQEQRERMIGEVYV